jgi:hypothetical protein
MGKLSSIAAMALLSASSLMAAGTAEVEGVIYGTMLNLDDKNALGGYDTTGLLNLSVNVGYTTGEIASGLSVNLGARANRKVWEDHPDDWQNWVYTAGSDFESAVFHTANITYASDAVTAVAGRQEINLEWMSDYHEAAVGIFKAGENVTVIGGWTWKYAVSAYDEDASFGNIAEGINKGRGAGVINAIVDIEGFKVEPWFYYIPKTANWLGGKIGYENDSFGVSAAYTVSQLDREFTEGEENGGVLHINAYASFGEGFSMRAGYLITDKDGGTGALGAVGDNVNPLDEFDPLEFSDTNLIYAGVDYEAESFSIGALLGMMDTGKNGTNSNGKINELDLIASYGVTDWFALEGKIIATFGDKDAYKDQGGKKVALAAIFTY